ncbi:signal peptidase I [Nakamurella leprariae]|uniref:Signal peptidase I n=1 Tax=Nakamurella leprariae TaxID=2803911 RepID=A0A939C171_9ACTN|nr:signal peptidase I [Nakamurella leprariae]MBM9466872.1 signal peptidase I [Nakamurella leprariae]
MSEDRSAAGDPTGGPPGNDPDAGATGESAAGASPSRRTRRARKQRPFWIELPILIVVAFVLTFLIQTFVAKVYYVPSGSMEQTLHGAADGGDRILANKLVYDFRDPRPGDVVVFKGPESWVPETRVSRPSNWFSSALAAVGSVVGIAPPDEKDYVKRVIAVGGQTVGCCDEGGNVTVDGRPLSEPYIYQPLPFQAGQLDCNTSPMSQRCFGPVTVPDGQLWVMGDHRSDSADSSYQCQGLPASSGARCQGPVPIDNVIGKAVFIVLPPSRWGTIGDPDIDPGG